jgi:hypothetical protein
VALLLHKHSVVNRRIALVLAALILPGGLVVLVGAAVVKAFYRTEAGRKAWGRVTHFLGRPPATIHPLREAA